MSTATKNTPRQTFGSGFYSLEDLRSFVAIHGERSDSAKTRYWLTSVLNPVDHKKRRPDYSFSDLISLFVVNRFRQLGVKPREIRAAEKYLRDLWKTDRPFIKERFQSDGTDIFYDEERITGQLEAANRHGQQTMRAFIAASLTDVIYSDEMAIAWRPIEGVVVDPEVQFGEPVVEGTRLPTKLVCQTARDLGKNAAEERFEISWEQVEAACAFETERHAGLAN